MVEKVTLDDLMDRLTPEGVERMKEAMLEDVLDAVAEQAVKDAPKDRGESSSKSIVSRIKWQVEKTGEWGKVQARAPHSHLLEWGVDAHPLHLRKTKSGGLIRKRGGSKVLKIYGTGAILRAGAYHRGAGKQPFMEPAPDKAHSDIEQIMEGSGESFVSGKVHMRKRAHRRKG